MRIIYLCKSERDSEILSRAGLAAVTLPRVTAADVRELRATGFEPVALGRGEGGRRWAVALHYSFNINALVDAPLRGIPRVVEVGGSRFYLLPSKTAPVAAFQLWKAAARMHLVEDVKELLNQVQDPRKMEIFRGFLRELGAME